MTLFANSRGLRQAPPDRRRPDSEPDSGKKGPMSAILSPALLVCLLLGSLFGLAFYYLFGGKADRLPVLWATGVAGFLVGQIFAGSYPLAALMLGEVHILEASLASVLALLIARLSTIKPKRR